MLRFVMSFAVLAALAPRALAQTDEPASPVPWAVDSNATQPLANGCTYRWRVAGTIQRQSPEALVTALSVTAALDCANEASMVGGDDVVWLGPMSTEELRRDLTQRSTVITQTPR